MAGPLDRFLHERRHRETPLAGADPQAFGQLVDPLAAAAQPLEVVGGGAAVGNQGSRRCGQQHGGTAERHGGHRVLDQPGIEIAQLLADVRDETAQRDRVGLGELGLIHPLRLRQDRFELGPPRGLARLAVVGDFSVVAGDPVEAGAEWIRRQPTLVEIVR